jgi:hypothetical protein
MKLNAVVISSMILAFIAPAQAINATYRKQLERSGCTQVSEAQGCDITKTKAENEKAGFGVNEANASPYSGNWVATQDGKVIAKIQIDAKEQVRVNNKLVKAKRSDGGLVFKDKKITYRIQGDRRLKDEDVWNDFGAKVSGAIKAE